jgi:enamine deaminase RidA (YjgF/YER057c/UK114 family)
VPEINRATGGMERYRLFNEARHRAFELFHQATRGNVPAACALGSMPGGTLVVYFLAGATPGDPIENPRQISAYDYPSRYGAFSPKFSRATLANNSARPTLFISGTASIIGHHTMHVGDVLAQTRETVTNIRALVAAANRAAHEPLFCPERLKHKVYLRNPSDFEAVARELDATMPHAAPIVYLQADVCRRDLLIEIEAVGSATDTRPH